MPLLSWGDQYRVGVPSIDAQHRRLFDLVNELHDAMRSGHSNEEVVEPVLKALSAYVVTHFTHEEELMAECGYPQLEQHKAEHRAIAQRVQHYCDEYSAGRTLIAVELMAFMKAWLIEHILESDMEYSPYMKDDKDNA